MRPTLARAIPFPPGFLSGLDERSSTVNCSVCSRGCRNSDVRVSYTSTQRGV